MSSSGVHGLIPHQPGYYYITLEEDYVLMFQRGAERWYEQSAKTDEDTRAYAARRAHAVAKAYISSVLEQLSDKQFKDGKAESDIWVFLSFPEIESRIHGGVKMRTLKSAMKEMIEDGYVEKRPNPDRHYKNLIYHMNVPRYRRELSALPSRLGDGANTHDHRANLHAHRANLHDDPCKFAPKNNRRRNKEETKRESMSPVEDTSPGKAHTQECSSSSPPTDEKDPPDRVSEIERIYTIFDRLGQEIVKDPTFHYPREEKVTTAIARWLRARSVPYDEGRLQEIYQKLWKSPPDRRTGFDWKENMTIPAILGQYDRLSLALVARARHDPREQTYQMTGYSRPVEEPAEELPFVGVSKLRTLSTGKEKRR